MDMTLAREALIELTRENPFDRFEHGRPCVPTELLDAMPSVTTEQALQVLHGHGYVNQFEGGWFHTHPDRILAGRAVTAAFVPARPDLHERVESAGAAQGRIGAQNSWVIDTLRPGDVMVVDMFGKVEDGPFVGDNLATSLAARTGAGAVIDGTIRDLQGVVEIDDLAIFCRGVHPSAIRQATLVQLNGPLRIGRATVLPGDVVLGTPTGVIFIPPQLASEVVDTAQDVSLRDRFGKRRLREGVYTPGQIDRAWTEEMERDFEKWRAAR